MTTKPSEPRHPVTLKCPACQDHDFLDGAWLPCEGGHYKSSDHYPCANCGPVPKDYIDLMVKRLASEALIEKILRNADKKLIERLRRWEEKPTGESEKYLILIGEQAAHIVEQSGKIEALKTALKFISEWKLPRVQTDSGDCSYGTAYGSNGERDYMIAVAKAALTPGEKS
jgi:hypothetical protein